MATKAVLAVEALRKFLHYDPVTGNMTWLPRPMDLFPVRRLGLAWNTRYAGTPALNKVDASKYRSGTIFGQKVYAHRAAIALLTGAWPASVDHINGDCGDNRAVNLRAVDHATNLKNTRLRSDNKSGVCGVFQTSRSQKWRAKIRVSGRDIYLGEFENMSEAISARKTAEALHGFHENHGRAV